MSSTVCSAAEIAEKKRIALEKLRAKKAQMQAAKGADNGAVTSAAAAGPSSVKLAQKPVSSFYKSPPAVAKSAISPPAQPPTGASAFLNSMKQSQIFTHRKEAREATHPYQRPITTPTVTHKPILSVSPQKPQMAPVFMRSINCKVYAISQHRFVVQPSGYHAKLIQVFHTIPSKAYDPNTRLWSFAFKDYQLVQQSVCALNPDVVIGSMPKTVLSLLQAPARKMDRSCLASIESTLANKLLPFQQEGVCFTIAQHGRIMICDEMGLGKTYQALAVADFYREDWPLLICTTASIRESWATHIRELLPSLPLHQVQTLTSNQQYIGDVKVLITSYNMLERHMTNLIDRRFGFLICDESHMLKNQKAKCTVVADRLAKQAKHILLLSGTPALSRPLELFSQLQMIDRKFMNFMDFSTRYCDGKQTNFGWDASGQSNLEELNVVLKLKYMIRRTKADVLPEMAEKFRETVVLDPALLWSNDDTKETFNKLNTSFNASKGRQKEEILLQFYSETAKVKTRAVCAYLKTIVKDKIKFIVFAHHRVMVDAICESLLKWNVNFIRIDGSTRSDLRAEYIDTFQKKSACQVAVLSLRACNSGITLTAAEMIVFAELDWNPSTLAQAESRAHRIGQKKPVMCRYLMATKTADDAIWNMLKNKQDVLNRAGLFCEDLQEATHTAAPTISNKIEHYFSPDKSKTAVAAQEQENSLTAGNEAATVSGNSSIDLQKELENIEAFFNDDDDEAFKDLVY